MLDVSRLEMMRRVNIETVGRDELVDVNTLHLDAFAPIEERAKAFFEQIKNPYAFRVGKTPVKVEYSQNSRSLHEALMGYLSSLRQDC